MRLYFLPFPLLVSLLPFPFHVAVHSYCLRLPLVQTRTRLIAAKW